MVQMYWIFKCKMYNLLFTSLKCRTSSRHIKLYARGRLSYEVMYLTVFIKNSIFQDRGTSPFMKSSKSSNEICYIHNMKYEEEALFH